MAVEPYDKQIWDTSSYVNPTRMNHIEDGIANAMTSGNMGYLGAKNLNSYPYNETTHTDHNITWTDNGDGTLVSSSGSATSANSDYTCHSHNASTNMLTLPNGTYIVSGCPSGGSTSKYYIQCGYKDTQGNFATYGRDTGSGVEITLNGDYYSNDSVCLNITCRLIKDYSAQQMTWKPMIRLKGDSDDTWQPYSKTNQELTKDKYERATANLMGAKNLWDSSKANPRTNVGITTTCNTDGTVTADGTADGTGAGMNQVWSYYPNLKEGDRLTLSYEVISGTFTKNTQESGTTTLYMNGNSGSGVGWSCTFPTSLSAGDKSSSDYTIQASDYLNGVVAFKGIQFYFRNGDVCDNLRMAIMIRVADDLDDTYEPYAMSNFDLTNNKVSLEQGDKIESNDWNLLRQPYYHGNQNIGGVDWTVNDDGSVTADGEATSNAYFNFKRYNSSNYHLPKGTYFISGCPSGGSASTYRMRVGVSADTSTSPSYPYPDDIGNGAFFTITDESVYLQINAVVMSGADVDNITFRPRIIPVKVPPCDKTVAGTYTLQCVVDANGLQTYSWV